MCLCSKRIEIRSQNGTQLFYDKDLQYEEELVEILDRDIQKVRNKEINSMKVKEKHHSVEKATFETEKDMRDKYP